MLRNFMRRLLREHRGEMLVAKRVLQETERHLAARMSKNPKWMQRRRQTACLPSRMGTEY